MDVYSKLPDPKFDAFIDRVSVFYSMPNVVTHKTWTEMGPADKMKYIIALCSHLDKGTDEHRQFIQSSIFMSFQKDAKRAEFLAECLSQLKK